jgi:hypothetical protein
MGEKRENLLESRLALAYVLLLLHTILSISSANSHGIKHLIRDKSLLSFFIPFRVEIAATVQRIGILL